MTASPTDSIATLRIEIKYIEPLIYRRIGVRTSIDLKSLHTVIQAAMGWLDYHLWKVVIDQRKYGIPDPDRPHVKNGATTQLAAVLVSGITEFGYVYDFGDNWEHRIVIEQTADAETGTKYPRFLGGERRCPAEDCGGPPGYFDFIENIARKSRLSLHSIQLSQHDFIVTNIICHNRQVGDNDLQHRFHLIEIVPDFPPHLSIGKRNRFNRNPFEQLVKLVRGNADEIHQIRQVVG
jgi:hypothetical protein